MGNTVEILSTDPGKTPPKAMQTDAASPRRGSPRRSPHGITMIRPATPSDLPAIAELLTAAKLPAADASEHPATFVVVESSGSIVGVAGLEIRESVALLRSLAVSPSHQGRGLATNLCDHLEAEAASRGVEHLYLLTETAEPFFSKRGYAAISRASAPPEIASTREFSELCPQSAVFMQRASMPTDV